MAFGSDLEDRSEIRDEMRAREARVNERRHSPMASLPRHARATPSVAELTSGCPRNILR
jgi:hypothetical protein